MSTRDLKELLPLTTLTYHILLALADTPRHGYGIIKEVSNRTDGSVELETGTLYAAIKRMRDDQLIEAVPKSQRPPAEDCRRRNYRLTEFGRAALKVETQRLAQLVGMAAEKSVLIDD